MAPSAYPRTPYTKTHAKGDAHLALATVGALPLTDANILSWNPFARNDTRYQNIILVGYAYRGPSFRVHSFMIPRRQTLTAEHE